MSKIEPVKAIAAVDNNCLFYKNFQTFNIQST